MKKLVSVILALMLALGIALSVSEQLRFPYLPGTEPTPETEPEDVVTAFINFWAENDYNSMLDLCSPAWKEKQDSQMQRLFWLLGVKTPVSGRYEIDSVDGTPEDTNRCIVYVKALMNKYDGNDPAWFGLPFVVLREDGQWYISPENLNTSEPAVTPEPEVTPVPELISDPEVTTEPEFTPDPETVAESFGGDMLERLSAFYDAWERKDCGLMLELCSPSWRNSRENAAEDLLRVMKTQTPVNYSFENITGNPEDLSRNVIAEVKSETDGGSAPVWYRNYVEMVREEGLWYVRPDSLVTDVAAEAAEYRETDEAVLEADAIMQRAGMFFWYWTRNQADHMLALCTADWAAEQENPKEALLALMGDRTPVKYRLDHVSVEDDGFTGEAAFDILVAYTGTDEKIWFRVNMDLVKEADGRWRIEPYCLGTFGPIESVLFQSAPVDAADVPVEIPVTPAPEETPVPEELPEPEKDPDKAEAKECVQAFFKRWAAGSGPVNETEPDTLEADRARLDEMLEMCAPSWIERESEYGDVREALLSCLGTRTPAVWSYESIGKNAYGTLCEVKMKVLPRGKDRESGSWDLRKVRLLLEDGKWYIDPPSLRVFTPEDAPVFSLENLFVPEDEEGKADQAAVRESFDTFFRWWSAGLLKETEPGVYRMDPEVKNGLLGLCLPSWVKAQEDPASELLRILGMKAPVKQLVNVHFLPDGGSFVSGMIYTDWFGSGESYRSYPMQAEMRKENGQWYIVPDSIWFDVPLYAVPKEPGPVGISPEEKGTTLYYNPAGGLYYHIDPNCEAVSEDSRPLQGQFRYGEIGSEPYSRLMRCNKCGAPFRPE